ncbi:M24 family metallopeptidase [Lactococcus kimchii]|uniref:M24 family metallopeptidase n=1 Tax=Lactococcus sp. S-13 TaxID=2507158 RepID=UPI001022F2F0|nr:M24 family metallopeptidase [Lactococcus sp. S-13]RZI48191.1 M24 family metallopeptidase [Lactococcus sp. S-13]
MIALKKAVSPSLDKDLVPVFLTDETMRERKAMLCSKMKTFDYDSLVIYADLEHGANFEYLTGFLPRFEEALLVLHQSGESFLILGNENLNKADKSRIPAKAIHLPHFSLSNQPMDPEKNLNEAFLACDLPSHGRVGLVGWKNFTSQTEDNRSLFDLPYFIVETLFKMFPSVTFSNATALFIGEEGVRTTNNANEFAHYEFGAALAGNCMLETMNRIEIGKTEMELATSLSALGQAHNVVTILASGERFVKANLYPTHKQIQLGERLALTTGYKGGLQSRSGYAVARQEELPKGEQDYLERIAIPYFKAVKIWLETIKIGMKGQELYQAIEAILPKKTYGWHLNPGHLTADEEWLSSPVYPESTELLRSGMLFQIDIIPSVAGYNGVSCESGIFLADEALRKEIEQEYPALWQRIKNRRAYLIEELGIHISEEILPTSNITAYLRPFLLDKSSILTAR